MANLVTLRSAFVRGFCIERGSCWRRGAVTKKLVLAILLFIVLAGVVVWGGLAGLGSSGSGAAAGSDGAGDPAAIARGHESYMSVCIACHGENGEAKPGLGKDLRQSAFFDGLNDEEAVAFLVRGRDAGDPLNTTGVPMPPKGGNPALGNEELRDIVAFVRSLEMAD